MNPKVQSVLNALVAISTIFANIKSVLPGAEPALCRETAHSSPADANGGRAAVPTPCGGSGTVCPIEFPAP